MSEGEHGTNRVNGAREGTRALLVVKLKGDEGSLGKGRGDGTREKIVSKAEVLEIRQGTKEIRQRAREEGLCEGQGLEVRQGSKSRGKGPTTRGLIKGGIIEG